MCSRKVAHYLSSLQGALRQVGVRPELRVTKSNGGVMSAEHAKTNCVQMILSGTASGVIGAAYIAEQCGLERAMSIDIGGTSADLALIVKGRPQYGVGETIGEFQIYIPSVAVSSIGEGGGSIAWVDPFGVLKVGPESAGSIPGPACYGRGGTRPTITDAFTALGLLGHSALGYNSVSVDLEAARRAVGTISDRIGTTRRAGSRYDRQGRDLRDVRRRVGHHVEIRRRSAPFLPHRLRRRGADADLLPRARVPRASRSSSRPPLACSARSAA